MSDTRKERHRPVAVLGDAVLWLASIAGLICIAAVVAAVGFQVTLIMFKTGSMEPTIPTGSLAVVHEIPASEIRVGDIVTVDRPGDLPVTHRVTSVEGGSDADTRTITMQGDANAADDVEPYVVTSVRIVWGWVPGLAQVVVWFSHPVVLGALTVLATALVVWAFWPRAIRGVSVGAVVVALAVGVAAAPAEPAHAAEIETVTSSAHLQLTSIRDPDLMESMTPGRPFDWQVGVETLGPEPGIVHLGIAATGELVDSDSLTIRVRSCPTRWIAGVCSGGAQTWLPTTSLASAVTPATAFGAREVGATGASETWLLITVTMSTPVLQEGSAQLRLQAWGVGESLSTGIGGLAVTGRDSGPLPALLAFVAIGGGLVIAWGARRHRRAVA